VRSVRGCAAPIGGATGRSACYEWRARELPSGNYMLESQASADALEVSYFFKTQ
jgi:hypothetical protein